MKIIRPIIQRVAILGLFLLAASQISADDWPQWRGPNRDNISSETGLLKQWPENGPPLEWQVEGIGDGIASVSIADGRICTVGYQNNWEYGIALDQKTVDVIWATRIGPAVRENSLMRWVSQRSPTLDRDHAYIVRADGDLVCLNTANGAELWRKSYPKLFGDARPVWGHCDYPLADGGQLICTPNSTNVGLAALDKVTGELIWKVDVPGVGRGMYGAIVPAEVGGERQYVTSSNTGVYGLAAADGELLWSYAKDPGRGFIQSLRVNGDEVLVGWEGGVALLKIVKVETGFEVREQFLRSDLRLDGFQDNLLAVDDRIYTISNGALVCLSRKTGETLWEHEPPQNGSDALGAVASGGCGREHPSYTQTVTSSDAIYRAW